MYSKELFEAIAGSGKHSYSVPRPTKKGLVDKRSLRTAKKGTSVKKGDKKAGSKVPGKERTFKLMKVYDIRPFNLETGKREPLMKGEGNICNRCGREHAVIYEIYETTPGQKRTWHVGSGCGPRILDGWSPDKVEVTRLKKESNIEAKAKAWGKRLAKALGLGHKFKNFKILDSMIVRKRIKTSRGYRDAITVKGYEDTIDSNTKIPVFEYLDWDIPIRDVDRQRLKWKIITNLAIEEGYGERIDAGGFKSINGLVDIPAAAAARLVFNLKDVSKFYGEWHKIFKQYLKTHSMDDLYELQF